MQFLSGHAFSSRITLQEQKLTELLPHDAKQSLWTVPPEHHQEQTLLAVCQKPVAPGGAYVGSQVGGDDDRKKEGSSPQAHLLYCFYFRLIFWYSPSAIG